MCRSTWTWLDVLSCTCLTSTWRESQSMCSGPQLSRESTHEWSPYTDLPQSWLSSTVRWCNAVDVSSKGNRLNCSSGSSSSPHNDGLVGTFRCSRLVFLRLNWRISSALWCSKLAQAGWSLCVIGSVVKGMGFRVTLFITVHSSSPPTSQLIPPNIQETVLQREDWSCRNDSKYVSSWSLVIWLKS